MTVRSAGAARELEARLDETEARLRRVAERYELATAAARVGVWDWCLVTGEFYLDPNIKTLLGYRDDEIPNDLDVWSQYVHPDDREAVMDAAQAAIDGRTREYRFEHRMLHRDGSVRWFMVRGSVIRDADGTPVRFVGTDTDITERRLLERKISELSSEAQTRIGHDLHDGVAQDLTAVSFLLGSLEQELRTQRSKHAQRVRELGELVQRAISSTRALAHSLSPVMDDFRGLAGELANLARHVEHVYRITCRVQCGCRALPSLDVVRCNHLYRITQEAIHNAVKHGGSSRIDISCAVEDNRFVLSITDNGCGIPQLQGEHQGLGLRIMDYRARSIGGVLTISAPPGGGTRVTCVCPVSGSAAQ